MVMKPVRVLFQNAGCCLAEISGQLAETREVENSLVGLPRWRALPQRRLDQLASPISLVIQTVEDSYDTQSVWIMTPVNGPRPQSSCLAPVVSHLHERYN